MRDRIGWCVAIVLELAALLGPMSNRARGQGGIAFSPVPAAIPDGVNLGTTGVVSADRRYVRVGVNAGFQTVTGFQTVNIPVGAVSGGAGLGFAGPGGFPGPGAGGFGGPGGLAGMNGPIPAGGSATGAAIVPGGFATGGGLGLPGPAAMGTSSASPSALRFGDMAAPRREPRSKRLRDKANRLARAAPAPATAVRPAAKPAPAARPSP